MASAEKRRLILLIVASLAVVAMAIPFALRSLLPTQGSADGVRGFRSGPEQVWQAVADPERMPLAPFARIVPEPPETEGLPRWREQLPDGTTLSVRTITIQDGWSVVRTLEDPAVPMSSEWILELTATEGGGCSARLRQRIEVNGEDWNSLRYRLLLALGGTRGGVSDYLARLARVLGEAEEGG